MLKHVLAGMALLGALVVLYLKSNGVDLAEHERFYSDVHRLLQVAENLNQDILKARYGLIGDYDGFPKHLREMQDAAEGLTAVPGFISASGREAIQRELQELSRLRIQQSDMLEHFKSQNAVLGNSLRHFPMVGTELIHGVGDNATGRELGALLNKVMQQVLVYSLLPSDEQTEEVQLSFEALSQWKARHAEDPQSAALSNLVTHANSIIRRKPRVEALIGELLALPIGERANEIDRIYTDHLSAAMHSVDLFRMTLYLLAAVLVLGIGYTLYAQNSANRDLEGRVRQRTADLSQNNVTLQAEIAERTRVQAELAYERDLLRTLLLHSPDQIYFKDLDSRFLKCSNTLVDRFELENAEALVGKSDFDFFTEDHALPAFDDEQRIIRTGIPVVGRVEKELWKNSDKVTWALTTKGPLRDRTGAIIGTFGTSKDITSMKEAEAELARVNKELLEISRQAGMAEVATSVLHNVGNVLNSVNVSCSVISEKVRKSRISSVGKTAELLRENSQSLASFLTEDPAGQRLPGFLSKLSERLVEEQSAILSELVSLGRNIEHIKEIVAMQQNHAVTGGVCETLAVTALIEDALRMNDAALERHRIEVVREFDAVPPVSVERHKVLQILVNLISNARQSLGQSQQTQRRIVLRVRESAGSISVSVIDNGLGIAPENMTRIFAHGFTTKPDGHGFGLHGGALAAQQMGGVLRVHSEGLDCGATFTLELPRTRPASQTATRIRPPSSATRLQPV